MRRWLLDLHLYLGLFCLPYVVLLGISSIALNHGVVSVTQRTWSAQIGTPVGATPREQAAATKVALGLKVFILPGTPRLNEAGELTYRALRAGRRYQVTVSATGSARVAERDVGLLGIVRDLHGAGERHSSRWAHGWSLYTDVTVGVLVFLVVSGVLLFAPRRRDRALNVGAAVGGLVACLALAASIW